MSTIKLHFTLDDSQVGELDNSVLEAAITQINDTTLFLTTDTAEQVTSDLSSDDEQWDGMNWFNEQLEGAIQHHVVAVTGLTPSMCIFDACEYQASLSVTLGNHNPLYVIVDAKIAIQDK